MNVLRLLNLRRVMLNTPVEAFNMMQWGHKCQVNSDGLCHKQGAPHKAPECGTVGCAAGRCAVDPWFVRNGLDGMTEKNEFYLNSINLYQYFDINPACGKWLFHDYDVKDPKEIARRVEHILGVVGVRCG